MCRVCNGTKQIEDSFGTLFPCFNCATTEPVAKAKAEKPKPKKKEDIPVKKKKVKPKTKEVVVTNTTKSLNRIIEMAGEKNAEVRVTDKMTIVTTEDGRRGRVYTDALVDQIRLRDELRAIDALAYTNFVKGRPKPRKESTVKDSKVDSFTAEDYGKIRFCRDCGCQVVETVDSDASICPECGIKYEYDKDVYTHCMDDEVVFDYDDPDGKRHISMRAFRASQPDFFDGKWRLNKEYLEAHPDVAKWLKANRSSIAKIKSEWVDGDELSLSINFGEDDDCPVMRDVSPEEFELFKAYSTRMTEVTDRKVIGLRTGFRRNLLRNPKVARERLNALRPLVCKDEIERLEYLLDEQETVYEYAFRAKVRAAISAGIIDMTWVQKNKYDLKGKMWKYTSAKNKAYWAKVKKES